MAGSRNTDRNSKSSLQRYLESRRNTDNNRKTAQERRMESNLSSGKVAIGEKRWNAPAGTPQTPPKAQGPTIGNKQATLNRQAKQAQKEDKLYPREYSYEGSRREDAWLTEGNTRQAENYRRQFVKEYGEALKTASPETRERIAQKSRKSSSVAGSGSVAASSSSAAKAHSSAASGLLKQDSAKRAARNGAVRSAASANKAMSSDARKERTRKALEDAFREQRSKKR